MADLFLTDGPVASEKITSGESKKFTAKTGEIGEAIPIIVLVDKDSASDSEIVAGALPDRKRAVLVGTRTYGKGSVQQLHTLSDGSQLRCDARRVVHTRRNLRSRARAASISA